MVDLTWLNFRLDALKLGLDSKLPLDTWTGVANFALKIPVKQSDILLIESADTLYFYFTYVTKCKYVTSGPI